MIETLKHLKNLVKNRAYHIDYPLFRLHYQVTVSLLLGFCLILTAKILFGDPIECSGRTEAPHDYYDNLCFTQGTLTKYQVPRKDFLSLLNGTRPALKRPPGMSVSDYFVKSFRLLYRTTNYSSRVRYMYSGIPIVDDVPMFQVTYSHRYYQYIPIMLFLQAVFFYLPHYLWKIWENGTISSVCRVLHENRFKPNDFIGANGHIVDYLKSCFVLKRALVFKYYLCQVLLLVNLVAQIVTLDNIFNNLFITYGLDVMYYAYDSNMYGLKPAHGGPELSLELNNPVNFVFPKVTACPAQEQSQAGDTSNVIRFLCVLPLNILNDKFFLVLWFWFVILTIVTIMQLVYDFVYLSTPIMRRTLFQRRFGYLEGGVKRKASLSEIFLLDLIGSNSDKFAFAALLKRLSMKDFGVDQD